MKKIHLLLLPLIYVIVLRPTPVFAISHCNAIQVDISDDQAYLPDPNCTPGVIDPAVTQDNLPTTICRSGYTKTVRPPASYTTNLKKKQIEEYGYADTQLSTYEEDHLISLELGGSPRDPANLWPEPHASINEKDTVENYLHQQLCDGQITLATAQTEISQNWYKIYRQLHPIAVGPNEVVQQLLGFIQSLIAKFKSSLGISATVEPTNDE